MVSSYEMKGFVYDMKDGTKLPASASMAGAMPMFITEAGGKYAGGDTLSAPIVRKSAYSDFVYGAPESASKGLPGFSNQCTFNIGSDSAPMLTGSVTPTAAAAIAPAPAPALEEIEAELEELAAAEVA